MTAFTLTGFPEGTEVGAYEVADFPDTMHFPEGEPVPTPVDTAEADSDGADFDLTDGAYYFGAEVSEDVWRWVRGTVQSPPPAPVYEDTDPLTFEGDVTFEGTVTVPEPTEDDHAATKLYVDENAGEGGPAEIDGYEVTTGDVQGILPELNIEPLSITDGDVAGANKDGLAATPSLRTLGTGAQQAAAGDHTHTAAAVGADPAGSAASAQSAAIAASAQRSSNLSDLANAATAFGNIKQAASDTATGVVELATAAETTTGTDAARAVTPDGLAGSDYGKRVVTLQLYDFATAATTGDGKYIYRIPAILNGYNLVAAAAHVTTVSSSGPLTIQLHNLTDTQDMLSTRITIDQSEKDSKDAAAAVVDATHDDVATGDEIRVDIDAAGTGAFGLSVEMTFQAP